MATKRDLSKLFDLQVDEYLSILKEGVKEVAFGKDGNIHEYFRRPSAAELNVIRQFLAQQNISADPEKHPGTKELRDTPFQMPDEDEGTSTYQ